MSPLKKIKNTMMKMAVKRDVNTVWRFTHVRASEFFSSIINKRSLNVVCKYYNSSNYIIWVNYLLKKKILLGTESLKLHINDFFLSLLADLFGNLSNYQRKIKYVYLVASVDYLVKLTTLFCAHNIVWWFISLDGLVILQ